MLVCIAGVSILASRFLNRELSPERDRQPLPKNVIAPYEQLGRTVHGQGFANGLEKCDQLFERSVLENFDVISHASAHQPLSQLHLPDMGQTALDGRRPGDAGASLPAP